MQFVVEPKQLKDIALLKYAGGDVMVVSTPFFSAGSLYTISEDEIKQYKEECDRLEVQLFVDVTRMFVDAEMPRLEAFMDMLKELQVDGIYFSDLSVYEIARDKNMVHLCIYQPDTLLTNSQDASLYLELGMKAVSIAKELTLDELCEISRDNEQRVEVVIHGVPLMSASKRRLISNYFEEISYEGERKPFYLLTEENRDAKMPIFEDAQGTHIFGGYCLYSYAEIETLKQNNIRYARIQSNFIDTVNTVIALKAYHEVLKKRITIDDAMKKVQESDPSMNYTSGFYYTKTSAKKEG